MTAGTNMESGTLPFTAVDSAFTSLVNGKLTLPMGGTSANWMHGDGSIGTIASSPAILVTNNVTHTIVTSSNSANGFTLSSTRPVFVSYSVGILSSSSLSGGASGYAVIETCSFNSSTGTDWMENARVNNGQNNALIVGLGLSQPGGGNMTTIVPAGYFVRIRSVNTVGTCTFTFTPGVETSM